MNIHYDNSFYSDLDNIDDKSVLSKLEKIITTIKTSNEFYKITAIKKLKGYDNFYRLRLGNYRIGIELKESKIIFSRFLHRKDIYKYFPKK
ncbi:MAG: type II toxin-antitoxin system RelE/ParE family toxin [Ignavibacteriae bacterium]|nr:type II toxin-antitoxin system RelE/ParE family toxin [Ignavibacteriota bacterium]